MCPGFLKGVKVEMAGAGGGGEGGFFTHFQIVVLVGMHWYWSKLHADDVR